MQGQSSADIDGNADEGRTATRTGSFEHADVANHSRAGHRAPKPRRFAQPAAPVRLSPSGWNHRNHRVHQEKLEREDRRAGQSAALPPLRILKEHIGERERDRVRVTATGEAPPKEFGASLANTTQVLR